MKQILIKIQDDERHAVFKKKCLEKNKTMSAVIREFIDNFTEEKKLFD